jgi:Orange carotenoid protein, N-terminal
LFSFTPLSKLNKVNQQLILGEFIMVTATTNNDRHIVEGFQALEVDQQLALFWFVYTEMGGSITPAAPGASTASEPIAQGLFDQVKAMSRDEQLQVQRDLIARKDGTISREYGALSDTTKLLFWYLLAVGMEQETIIPMPPNYQLSEAAQNILDQLKQAEFEQQMTIFRDIVSPMGVDTTSSVSAG